MGYVILFLVCWLITSLVTLALWHAFRSNESGKDDE
jgi:hypothetical protein